MSNFLKYIKIKLLLFTIRSLLFETNSSSGHSLSCKSYDDFELELVLLTSNGLISIPTSFNYNNERIYDYDIYANQIVDKFYSFEIKLLFIIYKVYYEIVEIILENIDWTTIEEYNKISNDITNKYIHEILEEYSPVFYNNLYKIVKEITMINKNKFIEYLKQVDSIKNSELYFYCNNDPSHNEFNSLNDLLYNDDGRYMELDKTDISIHYTVFENLEKLYYSDIIDYDSLKNYLIYKKNSFNYWQES